MKIKPTHIIILSFAGAIILGAVLLCQPFAAQNGNKISFIDSLFTATSATCVTGLIVKDTAAFFSPLGKFIIIVLIQAGGLGIMTFSTFFAILLGRKLTIKDSVIIQSAVTQYRIENLKSLIKYIIGFTLSLELFGAFLLFLRWLKMESWSLKDKIFHSLFHSVSAFCNAGFSTFSDNLCPFLKDPFVNLIIISLIVIGGLGFVTLIDLPKFFRRTKQFTKISVQTKIVLTATAALIISGTVFIFFMEKNNALANLGFKDRVLASLFQSVTARTAGFSTVDIGRLLHPTLFFIVFLMFIGASPGSTGGGIKTCTFVILCATFYAMLHNKERASIFKTTIPKEVVRKAVVVFLLAIAWIFIITMILLITEESNLGNSNNYFIRILFEVVSAFATVGLSANVTPYLSTLGKTLIIITMFAGRVGLLIIALSIALQKEKTIYTYPEERIMVG